MKLLRVLLPVLVFGIMALAPHQAFAANATFFGPIFPEACHCDAASNNGVQSAPDFGCILQVIENLMNFAISIGTIIFVLVAAYAGFLFMFSSANPHNKELARGILGNAVIGLLIMLCAWLMVDFVMKTLYNGRFGPWNSILGEGKQCLVVHTPPAGGTGSVDASGVTGTPGGQPPVQSTPSTIHVGDHVECSPGNDANDYVPGVVTAVHADATPPNVTIHFDAGSTGDVRISRCRTPGTTTTTTSSAPSTAFSTRICSAAASYRGHSTSAGPGNGRLACAWAVNNILTNANISNIGSTNVAGMESALRGGRGTAVSASSAVCGDIIIEAGDDHVGVCLNAGCSQVISNSSSHATFSWRSGPDFAPSYSSGMGRIYRVTR